MPRTPTAGPPVLLALLAVLTACSGHPAARSAATAPARSVPPPSTAPATAAVTPVPTVLPTGQARTPTAPPRRSPVPTVPVVPVAMINTDVVQPTGQVIPRLGRVGMRIGRPLDFSRYAGMEDDRFVLRSITDEIMYELMLLSGQEYVDTYATQAKADLEQARLAARELREAETAHRRAS